MLMLTKLTFVFEDCELPVTIYFPALFSDATSELAEPDS